MCHNSGTWHNLFQVKLTSEELSQRTNCKTKRKLKSQKIHLGTIVPVSLGNNRTSATWEQLSQCHLGTIVPVSLGNNHAIFLGTIMLVSPGNNHASLTWGQSFQSYLGTIVPVSFENNCASVTSKNFVPVSLENNCASLTWNQLRYCHH